MINFLDGCINLKGDRVGFDSSREQLDSWIERNNIEKIPSPSKDKIFFRLQDELDKDTQVKVILTLNRIGLISVAIRRLDWIKKNNRIEDVDLKELMHEFDLLVDKVKHFMKREPDQKRRKEYKWNETWGGVLVALEENACETAIFLDRKL